jgi:hypothetical protein
MTPLLDGQTLPAGHWILSSGLPRTARIRTARDTPMRALCEAFP